METLSDLGEFGLIDRLNTLIRREGAKADRLSLGIGDDAACFRCREGFEVLVTCDSMVEGRHYLSGHITPQDLGRRAMAINISDIGAMGGHVSRLPLGTKPVGSRYYRRESHKDGP